jgi:hypothetical protein
MTGKVQKSQEKRGKATTDYTLLRQTGATEGRRISTRLRLRLCRGRRIYTDLRKNEMLFLS